MITSGGTFHFILFISFTLFSSIHSSDSGGFPENAIRKISETHELPEDVIGQLKIVRDQGVKWLLSQRTDEFGWPSGETARVVVALASAVEDWPAKNDLVARLTVKQLEIELLEKLLRKDVEPFSPAKAAFFSLALTAACKDSHNFYGHNLIASLEKHHDDTVFPGYPDTFGFSLTSLASCLSGSHLHKRQTRHLVQISRDETTQPYSTDTRGTALMALECVRHRKKSESLSRHMHEPLATLSGEQREDGSFGNIHTTAIAIQTLAASGDSDVNWNETAAALALVTLQEPNGSFMNNLYATTESVIAASSLLNGVGLIGLRRGHCNNLRHRYRNNKATVTSPTYVTDVRAESSVSEGSLQTILKLGEDTGAKETDDTAIVKNELMDRSNNLTTTTTTDSNTPTTAETGSSNHVSVKYWLWIGPDPPTAERYNLTVHVQANSTFFFVMQRAAELASEYEFASTVWPNGHFIHTISGQREQPIGYHYWLLYLLPSDPDPASPPPTTFVAPAGVDDLRVEDGQVYLFWFKKI